MEETSMTDAIIANVIHEISTQLPYSELNTLYNYFATITIRQPFYLVYEFNRYRMKRYNDNHSIMNYKFGSNMFVIILPIEGEIIITTLDIVEKMSGLSLWVTNPQLSEKILQFNVYNYDISKEPIKSPKIIVSELPSRSLILENLHENNSTKVTTLHELLKYPE